MPNSVTEDAIQSVETWVTQATTFVKNASKSYAGVLGNSLDYKKPFDLSLHAVRKTNARELQGCYCYHSTDPFTYQDLNKENEKMQHENFGLNDSPK